MDAQQNHTSVGLSTAPSSSKGVSPKGVSFSSITLASVPNPSVFGHSVTFTATVNAPGATGLVTFYDGSSILGLAPVSGGFATLTTVLLNAGSRKVTARYDGNPTFASSLSTVLSQTVTDVLSAGFPVLTQLSAGSQPNSVAVGDFNGDGHQDIAVVNTGGNTVSIFLGNGAGGFSPPSSFATDTSPQAVVITDFNGDGIEDLAVTSQDGVSIFLGNGNGTFRIVGTYPANIGPAGLAVGDFNKDGLPDLAVSNTLSSTVSILLGNGAGGFQPTENIGTNNQNGSGDVAVAVGDFNLDGNPDVATVDSNDGFVYVFLGAGAGTFGNASVINVGGNPSDIVSADLNGDGIPDLVIPDSLEDQIFVLLGVGNGTFQSPAIFATGTLPAAVTVGDFNGDGIPDIAVANSADSTVSIFAGLGNGSFQPGVTYPPPTENPGGFIVDLATGEFNGDGVTDFALANSGSLFAGNNPGGLDIMLGGSCGFSTSPASFAYDDRAESTSLTLFSTNPSCSWTASSDSSWLTIGSTSGTGTASVTVTLTPNFTGVERVGNITIGGQVVPVTQWGTQQVFSDVVPTDYYFDAVNLLSAKNITAGCGNDDYCPTVIVTRDQMAILIVRMVYNGNDNFTYSPTPYFSDVPTTAFGFKWIQKLFELGITASCGNGDYCPTLNVTRDQMAIFITRGRYGSTTTFDYPGTPFFTDVPTYYFAFPWIQRLKVDGITGGCGSTTYCPTLPVSRADMALFIMRGGFNQLLAPGAPALTTINPSTITPGQTATFTISGVNTNLVQGVTSINQSSGYFTVDSISVTSPTSMNVQLTASPAAPVQPVSIFATTGSQEEVLPNGISIQ